MNFPVNKEGYHYYNFWKPVIMGEIQPTEYQKKLISIVEDALENGLFYSDEILSFVKENNSFIPSDAWDLQFEREVVSGFMGMEVYEARQYVREEKRRTEIREGNYLELTQELVELAFENKKKVILFGNPTKYNPREISGKVYLMKPRARKYALTIAGQYCKLI